MPAQILDISATPILDISATPRREPAGCFSFISLLPCFLASKTGKNISSVSFAPIISCLLLFLVVLVELGFSSHLPYLLPFSILLSPLLFHSPSVHWSVPVFPTYPVRLPYLQCFYSPSIFLHFLARFLYLLCHTTIISCIPVFNVCSTF